jgi:hypothetical protein
VPSCFSPIALVPRKDSFPACGASREVPVFFAAFWITALYLYFGKQIVIIWFEMYIS